MKIAVLGDRSPQPEAVLPFVQTVVIKALKEAHANGEELQLVSGLDRGVEAAVRWVATVCDITVIELERLNKDWDAYAADLVEAGVAKVFYIHGAPMQSSIYPRLVANPELQDRVELVTPDLLFV